MLPIIKLPTNRQVNYLKIPSILKTREIEGVKVRPSTFLPCKIQVRGKIETRITRGIETPWPHKVLQAVGQDKHALSIIQLIFFSIPNPIKIGMLLDDRRQVLILWQPSFPIKQQTVKLICCIQFIVRLSFNEKVDLFYDGDNPPCEPVLLLAGLRPKQIYMPKLTLVNFPQFILKKLLCDSTQSLYRVILLLAISRFREMESI